MKNKNKGFTLIEILGAITILGIISTTAVISYTRYIKKTKVKAYNVLIESMKSAAENYVLEKGKLLKEDERFIVNVTTLIDGDYIKPLKDPAQRNNSTCDGRVAITRKRGSGTSVDKYEYKVDLNCSEYSLNEIK